MSSFGIYSISLISESLASLVTLSTDTKHIVFKVLNLSKSNYLLLFQKCTYFYDCICDQLWCNFQAFRNIKG